MHYMVNANPFNNYFSLNILKVIGLKLYGMWDKENSTMNYYENLYCIWYKFKDRHLYESYPSCMH